MEDYNINNILENDIYNILKNIPKTDYPNFGDKNYVFSCIDYIKLILGQIYDSTVIKKYLYDEILFQFVYLILF